MYNIIYVSVSQYFPSKYGTNVFPWMEAVPRHAEDSWF